MLTPEGEVLASVTHSQDSIHERYGGVVPEVASRAHVERMTAVVSEALRQAGCGVHDLGGVAATVGPGLIGALLVGVQTAKAIAWSQASAFLPGQSHSRPSSGGLARRPRCTLSHGDLGGVRWSHCAHQGG